MQLKEKKMKLNSKSLPVKATPEKIFTLTTNCRNFGNFLPEQVSDWEASDDYCKFSFQGMVTLTLRITEKVEFSKVVFEAENNHRIPVIFIIHIDGETDESTIAVETQIEVPIYLSAMVKKPLQTFVDMVAEKIKTEAEK